MYASGITFTGVQAAATVFPSPAARNGLSIDGTGAIVLGQDVGGAGAALLNNREIPLVGFSINFLSGNGTEWKVSDPGLLTVGGVSSASIYTYWFGEPNNFGTVYPGHGIGGRFMSGWQRFDGVNTYPRPNVVHFWGYNTAPGGGLENAGESGFSCRYETDFDLNGGGSDYFEIHNPEVTIAGSGLVERLWSYYISKVTGATIHQSQIQSFNFNTKNENETWWAWTATTSGGNPDTDRQIDLEYIGKGNTARVLQNYSDQGAIWATGNLTWDRGSLTLGISPLGASFNNKIININGNVRQTGVTASSSISTFSVVDQPTIIAVQLISATFVNNPSFLFDRRNGAGTVLADGTNAGELTWNQGGRDMQLLGRANGTHNGGVQNCFDAVINGFDVDSINYDQLVVGRNGNSVFRGTIKTGDPGLGAGAWLLGTIQAAASVLDATRYVQVSIGGVVVKLAVIL